MTDKRAGTIGLLEEAKVTGCAGKWHLTTQATPTDGKFASYSKRWVME